MEILLQIIPSATADDRIKAILERAGFTEEEIKERFG